MRPGCKAYQTRDGQFHCAPCGFVWDADEDDADLPVCQHADVAAMGAVEAINPEMQRIRAKHEYKQRYGTA